MANCPRTANKRIDFSLSLSVTLWYVVVDQGKPARGTFANRCGIDAATISLSFVARLLAIPSPGSFAISVVCNLTLCGFVLFHRAAN